MIFDKRIWIKGAGDLASGIALRLYRCGFNIIMSDIEVPTTVRRTVAFSRAVYEKEAKVENVLAELADSKQDIERVLADNKIAVVVDPDGILKNEYKPDIVVDAIIAKYNIATRIDEAEVVIGVGPGFYAGKDVHAVVETKRGHDLGRVIHEGEAFPNTGVPGKIGGYDVERIIRATKDGVFRANTEIGKLVKKGDIVAYSDDEPIFASIDGVVRGLLQDGVQVIKGMKSGDIDPRGNIENCYTVSDKATAIGGGVLEAILSILNNRA